MPVDIARAAEEMDRALRTQERATVQSIRRYLEEAHRRLTRDLNRLYKQARADTRNESRVFREARARAILAQLEGAMDALRLGSQQSGVPRAVEDMIVLGRNEGPQQVAALLGELEATGARPGAVGLAADVNFRAIEAQAANATQRLTRYSDEAIDRINQAVIDGLASGRGVRDVQREVKKAILAPNTLQPGERVPRGRPGGLAFRAETIARTELISALEDAREDTMREEGIEYVVFQATRDERTCVHCAGRTGNVYRLRDIQIPLHPRCRCLAVPARREWIDNRVMDVDAIREDQEETRRIFEDAHGKDARYSTGPAPFERAAGWTSKPKPVWTPSGGWQ